MALSAIAQLKLSTTFQWNVTKTRTGLQPVNNQESLVHTIDWSLGAGADSVNELVALIETITAGATDNFDLSAALTNVVNDTLITLARVKFVFFKLLTASDTDADGNVIGNACSGVTIGGHATQQCLIFDDATDKVTLGPGDMLLRTKRDATGIVVTGGSADLIKIVNNDGAVAAKLLIVLGGAAT